MHLRFVFTQDSSANVSEWLSWRKDPRRATFRPNKNVKIIEDLYPENMISV